MSECESGDTSGFRQQLSTMSFEAFELEILVNYTVHTPTENGSFMQNLISWSMPFWLVFLTEHKVLQSSTAMRQRRSTAACLPDNYSFCGFSSHGLISCRLTRTDHVAGPLRVCQLLFVVLLFSRCFQVSNPCLTIHSTASVHHTALTDEDFLSKLHLPVNSEISPILFNFY